MTRPALMLCLLLAMPWAPARAQHPPLTARTDMPAAATSPAPREPAPSPPASETPAYRPTAIGEATRALLRLQAEGTQAGHALPMLGETATHSYQRYLDSFDHPIPEYFDAALPTSGSGATRR